METPLHPGSVGAETLAMTLVGLRPITAAAAASILAGQSVPVRALTISFVAMAAAVAASVL
jgi:hypothetical protein